MKSAPRFLRLALLIGTATSLNAQGWTVGLKGGLGQGGFTKRSEFVWSAKGMNLALSFSRPVTERISIQPELATSQTIGQSTIGGSVLTYSSDDINMPLLVRADLSQRTGITPFVLAGPSLTIHAHCNLQFIVAGAVSDIDCDKESLLSRLDFAVVAGGGVSKAFGSKTFSVELRANLNARNEAMPDGSGYGRRLGWAILTGLTMPLNANTYRGRTPNVLPAGTFRMSLVGLDGDSAGARGDSTRVSVSASDADVRAVLVTIALQAGVSLIVAENVRGRVSVTLPDTSALNAMRAVVARTGLVMSRSSLTKSATTWIVEKQALRAAQLQFGPQP